ncbi:MAG: FprA family A-type flavoprotein [Bacteroidales bacterium]|nr:FprA family A-type flavoprotein [Bacteroidales bacterium]
MKGHDDRIIDVSEDVKWIGILDWDIRTFDIVMETESGTTYNSYFINAEKKTLVEVAKEKFSKPYLDKLRSVADPEEIQYIVLDHTEPDHSGTLKQLLKIAPSATVVGSGNAIRYIEDIINMPFKSLVVRDGDTLSLGNKTLKFISAPNLHWPDTIYTWLVEERILFTCDSFGAHYCSNEMKDDLTDNYVKALKYYFDVILKPFSRFMIKAIEKIRPLDISVICTGHGPILRKNWRKVVDLTEMYAKEYLEITGHSSKRNILIAYVSAYGYTQIAAEQIASGIREKLDCTLEMADIEHMGSGELEALVIKSDAVLVGSPTINQNTLLPVYKLFAVINPLRDKGKPAGAFGSYGWSGEAPKIILENLRNLKFKVFEENAIFKFHPGGSKEEALKEYGRKFALEMLAGYNKTENPGS